MIKRAPLCVELLPNPADGAAYWVRADDGVRLRVGYWNTASSSKGSVLLFPGRTQYIELHGRTVASLQRSGYHTVIVDWRGHGMSDRVTEDRKTIHVNRFSDYQKDVAAVVSVAKDLELPQPWFLIGSSLGGCIGLRAIAEGLPVKACAFTGPMWGIKLKFVERFAAWSLSWGARAFGRGQIYCPGQDGSSYTLSNPFEGNRITTDNEMYELWRDQAAAHPDLQTGGSSLGWLYEGLVECRRLSKLPVPSLPCIAFYGDQDAMIDICGNRKTYGALVEGRSRKN